MFDGIMTPTRRQVFSRKKDRSPSRAVTSVRIDIEDVTLDKACSKWVKNPLLARWLCCSSPNSVSRQDAAPTYHGDEQIENSLMMTKRSGSGFQPRWSLKPF
jgi:hypothetical protein